MLRNKQYEILTKPPEQKTGENITEKNLEKGIGKVLSAHSSQNKEAVKKETILAKIFAQKREISYDEFCSAFAPKIYEN